MDAVRIGASDDCDEATRATIKSVLQELIPWRKGPYFVHDIHIDTEWRSDWKWDRVLPHLAPLKDRLILDVGCGNGYHCWRMLGAGAKRVIGIDPSPRFIVQFHMIKHFAGAHHPVDVLPLGIEELPEKLHAFDTVFSMGVFYHRRSPMDHLLELKNTLRPGGQLVLETLVIEGGLGDVLVPEGRYGMMNNVWFLPSCDTMLSWLRKMGYQNPRVVDICPTTTEEQRATEWMRFHSLPEFLHPDNSALTVEGHPAPIRAVFVAEA
jgi:tRNA (mo5U34)-methyltransferase